MRYKTTKEKATTPIYKDNFPHKKVALISRKIYFVPFKRKTSFCDKNHGVF